MESFYSDLPSFEDFQRLGETRHYRRLPDDWMVVICDIRGSTKAIEEGRYQDVNTLGAASIAAVQSTWPGHDMPFVFGGDGSSFLIPNSRVEDVKKVLAQLQAFARQNYAMELLVGVVPARELNKYNQFIDVAKFSIAKGKSIAFMRGGGLAFAEQLVKSDPERYALPVATLPLEELRGLSCRWRPLHSRRGSVLSILIKPLNADPSVLETILAKFDEIFEGDLPAANPVDPANMKYDTAARILKTESKYFRSRLSGSFLGRLLSICVSIWAFRWGLPVPFKAKEYTAQIPGHSDYRKYDDMLRMILDCTPSQIQQVDSYLQTLHQQKKICYGLHPSSHALMTCLVENLREGGHIHFIDGGDGGYAIAAKHLKDQLAKL